MKTTRCSKFLQHLERSSKISGMCEGNINTFKKGSKRCTICTLALILRAISQLGRNWPICLFVFIGLAELDSPLSHSREEGVLFIRLFRGTVRDRLHIKRLTLLIAKGFILVGIFSICIMFTVTLNKIQKILILIFLCVM